MLTYADVIMYTGVPSVFDAVAPACPPPQVAAGCLNGGSAYAHACGAIRTRRRGAGVRRVREKKREKRVGTKRFGVAARRARKRVPTAKGTQLHMSAYVSIRQHSSAAYVSIRARANAFRRLKVLSCIRQHTSAYVSIRPQHTSAYALRRANALRQLKVLSLLALPVQKYKY